MKYVNVQENCHIIFQIGLPRKLDSICPDYIDNVIFPSYISDGVAKKIRYNFVVRADYIGRRKIAI